MKKLLALACSLVLCLSMIASMALVADASGATATLEFAGYEVKGTTTFAKIVVKASIPETLIPYKMNAADWETTFEDTYEGKMIQSVGFDIPYVAGLTYVGSLSSAASYVQIQDNKTASKIIVYAANSGAYDTYYAGEVDVLATLYYRITGDVDAAYDVNLTAAKIGLVDVAADGTVTPYEYNITDITNTTVAPAQPEPEEEKVVMTAAPFITEVATSTEANGWQAGQAVALQFATADLAEFDAMNWKLTVAGVNKFAKVDDAAFATIKATAAETVDVFASFIVNTAENTEATPITAVSAGFKKADGTVVEAE